MFLHSGRGAVFWMRSFCSLLIFIFQVACGVVLAHKINCQCGAWNYYFLSFPFLVLIRPLLKIILLDT